MTAEKFRIYCETLPLPEVIRPRTLALLGRHPFEIVLAVRPWQLAELPAVAHALAERGIPLSVWPMLADAEGRWASALNADAFAALLLAVVDALGSAPPREVLLDLEPPFTHARALAGGAGSHASSVLDLGKARPERTSARAMDAAATTLARAVATLHDCGIATASAVWPLVALDPLGMRGWQSLLGTPVDALATERVSVMVYTSILEGWSRGTVRRRDAKELLSAATSRAVGRWGDAAGVSIGCVGTGALVDEPIYRAPSELAEDAALVRAAGCNDLSLFDLGGVLSREPAEAWLDAFVHGAELGQTRASKRVQIARKLSRVATWLLSRR